VRRRDRRLLEGWVPSPSLVVPGGMCEWAERAFLDAIDLVIG
jgi:hypothetical protein